MVRVLCPKPHRPCILAAPGRCSLTGSLPMSITAASSCAAKILTWSDPASSGKEDIAQSLRWLGLDWDEGLEVGGPHGPPPNRTPGNLQGVLSRLWLSGHVYYCFCTPEELERDREEAMARGDNPVYSGRCRDLTPAQVGEKLQAGLKPTIRFKVPRDEEIIIQDLIRGEVSFNSRDVGDFIIVKSDGIPTYNYAVVIDDITMKITHVIRANEHLVNTRQVLIYQALGRSPNSAMFRWCWIPAAAR